MKVAIISDIHANISALSVVLDDIEKRKCGAVFCLGDYIGYYYWPNEVLNVLRGLDVAFFIKGNHEDLFFKSIEDKDFRKKIQIKYGLGIECAIDNLTKENLSFLQSLEASKEVMFSGVRFSMHHGSPCSIDEYVYPDATKEKLGFFADKVDAEVILLGHTHHQYSAQINNRLIINPGSVGQARDVRGLAAYSILNLQNMVVTTVRLLYDFSKIMDVIDRMEGSKNKMKKALIGSLTGDR